MKIRKIFINSGCQAVRIPKEYRFDCDEVLINKIGDALILAPKNKKWKSFIDAIDMISDDFFKEGRNDTKNQKRDTL